MNFRTTAVNVRNHRTSLPYTLVKIRMLIDLRPNESNHSNAKLTESIEQETPPQKLRCYFLDPLQWTYIHCCASEQCPRERGLSNVRVPPESGRAYRVIAKLATAVQAPPTSTGANITKGFGFSKVMFFGVYRAFGTEAVFCMLRTAILVGRTMRVCKRCTDIAANEAKRTR